jgi:hypothetical protein
MTTTSLHNLDSVTYHYRAMSTSKNCLVVKLATGEYHKEHSICIN